METATDRRTDRPATDGASHPARDGASHPDRFADRHLGPSAAEEREMLDALGYDSLDALSDAAVPDAIQLGRPLDLPDPLSASTTCWPTSGRSPRPTSPRGRTSGWATTVRSPPP